MAEKNSDRDARIDLARLLASLESPEMVSTKVGNMDAFVGKVVNILGTRQAGGEEWDMLVFEYDGTVYNMWLGSLMRKQIEIFANNGLLPIAGEIEALPTKLNDAYRLKPSSIQEVTFKIPEFVNILNSRVEQAALAEVN